MLKRFSPIILASGLLVVAGTAKAQIKPVGQAVIPPGSPYSAGVLANGTLYISGLQGVDPSTHKLPAAFGAEVKTCLDNIGGVLKDAHMNYSNVVSVQIFLVDISQFDQFNAIYKTYFNPPYPARITVTASELAHGAHIEIGAVAVAASTRQPEAR